MRKISVFARAFAALLALALFLSGPTASAGPVDLSGLSFDDLVSLREQLNLAIWNSQEWQEVTVPEGVWTVGQDIPAGHWSIRVAAKHDYFYVSCFDQLNEIEKRPAPGARLVQQDIASPGYSAFGDIVPESADLILEDGWFFKCGGAVIFTPYTGKPDLGFK